MTQCISLLNVKCVKFKSKVFSLPKLETLLWLSSTVWFSYSIRRLCWTQEDGVL